LSQGDDKQAASPSLVPGLYIVATPIGNLEDITLRALRVLRAADLIACEDTRHTQKLLSHFEIKKPTVSYHEHNEAARSRELLARIAAGERVALVSDAGTPGISDPGERIIRAAIESGVPVISVPGPSAFISALVASGLRTDSFRFLGFLPSRAGERRSALERLRETIETLVFYEAPHRILETLSDLELVFGPERRVVIARELTKVHEELLRGTASDMRSVLTQREAIKGEMTIIVEGRMQSEAVKPPQGLGQRMHELMEQEQLEEKAALKQAAKEFGISKSEAYREWQRRK